MSREQLRRIQALWLVSYRLVRGTELRQGFRKKSSMGAGNDKLLIYGNRSINGWSQMIKMIPKKEQACAILNAREWELARKYFDGNLSKLKEAFAVTRHDLKEYIEEHGFPKGWWHFAVGTQDGLYLVESDGMWVVYIQERGRIDYEYPEKFKIKEEGVDYILDNIHLKRH